MMKFHNIDGLVIAEPENDDLIISGVEDAIELLGEAGANNSGMLILKESNLHPDFFKLYTGLAGDILQKFSTYSFKLAIIGDFNKFTSKNMQDFIRECNRGNRIFFVSSFKEAVNKLSKYT